MKYPEKVDFREVLGPNLQIYYCYLVSQMADFINGGVFSGPKIRHFREFTVLEFYFQLAASWCLPVQESSD